jgi:hypothetical protein
VLLVITFESVIGLPPSLPLLRRPAFEKLRTLILEDNTYRRHGKSIEGRLLTEVPEVREQPNTLRSFDFQEPPDLVMFLGIRGRVISKDLFRDGAG